MFDDKRSPLRTQKSAAFNEMFPCFVRVLHKRQRRQVKGRSRRENQSYGLLKSFYKKRY